MLYMVQYYFYKFTLLIDRNLELEIVFKNKFSKLVLNSFFYDI
jgi:hypothetical protein